LIKSHNPEMTNFEIRERIEKSAIDIGPDGWDYEFGYGLVDFHRALLGGIYLENDSFVIGVTANPIFDNDIAIVVKAKVEMTSKPILHYWLITGEYSPMYGLGLIPLEGFTDLWVGKLNTEHVGAIRFVVDGQNEDSWMSDLEIEYYKD